MKTFRYELNSYHPSDSGSCFVNYEGTLAVWVCTHPIGSNNNLKLATRERTTSIKSTGINAGHRLAGQRWWNTALGCQRVSLFQGEMMEGGRLAWAVDWVLIEGSEKRKVETLCSVTRLDENLLLPFSCFNQGDAFPCWRTRLPA